jgi:hypothetical protein
LSERAKRRVAKFNSHVSMPAANKKVLIREGVVMGDLL